MGKGSFKELPSWRRLLSVRFPSTLRKTRRPVMDVSFLEFVDESGGKVLITRSGGGTWLAVVTLADGGRIGLTVGCGIGISPEGLLRETLTPRPRQRPT